MYSGWVLLDMHDSVPSDFMVIYLLRSSLPGRLLTDHRNQFRTQCGITEKVQNTGSENWVILHVSEKWMKRALNENKNEQICCLFIEKGIGASSWLGSMFCVKDDLPVQWCFSSLKQADSISYSVNSNRQSGNGIWAIGGRRGLNEPTIFW